MSIDSHYDELYIKFVNKMYEICENKRNYFVHVLRNYVVNQRCS